MVNTSKDDRKIDGTPTGSSGGGINEIEQSVYWHPSDDDRVVVAHGFEVFNTSVV